MKRSSEGPTWTGVIRALPSIATYKYACCPLNRMAVEGRVIALGRSMAIETVTYMPGRSRPSGLGMSTSACIVRLVGLSEKPERVTFPSIVRPGRAWMRSWRCRGP